MTRLLWPLLKEAHGHVVNIVGGAAGTPGTEFLIGASVAAAADTAKPAIPSATRQRRTHAHCLNENAAMANFSKGLSQLGKRDSLAGIVRSDQARSKRSRFITLVHAATKSFTNFSFESAHA